MHNERMLNGSYGLIQGSYWMIFAAMTSFSSVFLLANGFRNSEIGILIACANVLAILLQPLTADLADRSKRLSLTGILEILALGMMLLTAGVLVIRGRSMVLFIIYLVIIAIHTSLQPLINTLNFHLQDCGVHLNFGACRAVGSLLYAVLCLFFGNLVERFGITTIPVTAELTIALLIASTVATQRIHDRIRKENGRSGSLFTRDEKEDINIAEFIQRNKMFFVLNLGVFFLFIHNQILGNFTLQIVQDVGGNSIDLGRILSLMAFLEIPMMFSFDRISRHISVEKLIKMSALAFVVKIFIVWIAQSVTMIYVAQLFQLVSFAIFIPGIVSYTAKRMDPGEATKGQSLITMMMTISSIVASATGGFILDFGGAKMLAFTGLVTAVIGTVIIHLTISKK